MAAEYEKVHLSLRYFRNEIDGCYLFTFNHARQHAANGPFRYKSDYGELTESVVKLTPFTTQQKGAVMWNFSWDDMLLNMRNPFDTYVLVPKHLRKNVHWGQAKLFFVLLMPFIKFWDRKKVKRPHVVYAGAAPGSNIEILADLIPELTLDLYDPAPFAIKGSSRIKIFNQLFLDEDAEKYAGRDDIFFFSDIRREISTDSLKTERMVNEDMDMQQRWVEIIKPVEASLKFRLPYMTDGVETVIPTTPYKLYLDGEVYLQSFAPQTTTETRLRPMKDSTGNYRKKYWNFHHYENQMFYQNFTVRETFAWIDMVSYSFDGLYPPDLIGDWDSVSVTFMLYEFIRLFRPRQRNTTYPQPIEVIDLFKSIVGRLSTKNGTTLAKIRGGKHLMEQGDTGE